MSPIRAVRLAAGLLALTVVAGCSQSYVSQGNQALQHQNYEQAQAYFEQALQHHPDDPQIQSALGQVRFHKGDYDQAEQLLTAAQSRLPKDGTVILYLGMIAEQKGDYAAAADLYNKFLATNGKAKIAPSIKARLLFVQNKKLREQVDVAVKNERSLAADTAMAKTVGVLPFSVAAGASEDVKSLAVGMAAAVWYDLSEVKGLQLVERLELKYLTDELAAAEQGFIAKDSGPRLGKFVGAKHLVQGGLGSSAADQIAIQGGIINTGTSGYSPAYNSEDKFSQAMKAQQQLSAAILDSLGFKVSGTLKHEWKKASTDSYQAFLAFGRGVEQFDNGDYAKANAFFSEASRLDPSFGMANDFRDQAQMMQAGSTDLQRFSAVVLASIAAKSTASLTAGNELFEISTPDTDPRHQDLPTKTGGTGSTTVSGTVR